VARRRSYGYGYGYFPPSRPREAKGGIKAQSKRGAFGQSWWARRWIEVLESFDIGARLGRGRSYARKGQVLSVEVGKGTVTARVQGSRSTPYKVAIEVKTLSQADWKKLAGAFSTQAIFAAKLLAGEMPQDVETAFAGVGLSLFPTKRGDLKTQCSCPDWSNPCKHIAAVYYLLGEEFDRDPFLIFRLRGMDRQEIVERIGHAPAGKQKPGAPRRAARSEAEADATTPQQAPTSEAAPPEPLPGEPEAFWSTATLPDDPFGEVRVPPVAAALPKRLGSFPFWRGETHFLDAVEEVYPMASSAGLEVFVGRPSFSAPSPDEPPAGAGSAPRPARRRK